MTAEELASEVTRRANDPLGRLAAAVAIAEDVRDVADQLLDQFVSAARADGRSWSEIGTVLGVTKQAAQQRYLPAAPKDLSALLAAAERRARAFRHHYVGTEHVLLALVEEPGLAAETLARLGINPELVTRQIEAIIGWGKSTTASPLAMTPRTKRVLETARHEARRLGYRCAAPEHVLLALGRDRGGVGARVLRDAGANDERVRGELSELVAPELAQKVAAAPRRRLRRR
jgi:Clp amino terminal domain, pathogenicity island component